MAIAIGLLKMLLELQETRKTGVLDVVGPGARVRLFVENGSVVLADEGTIGETLGRILVREQVLTQEQYAGAIERMADLRASGKSAKLGRVFLDLGLLKEEQLHAALAAQVQQKAMRALGWPSATLSFVECFGPLELAERFETAIEPLLVSALRLADRERIDELLRQARSRFAALRGDLVPGGGSAKLETIARVNALRLTPTEEAFARKLDGSRTVGDLLAESGDSVDRGVILAALLLTDALDLHAVATSPRAATAARGANVPRPAAATSPARPRAALPKSGSPSSAKMPVSAHHPPSTPRSFGAAPMAPLLAEKAYQAGKKLVRAHRLEEAVAELKRAASLYPAVEYDLWAAWAEARADARGEDAHADALRRIAELAIEQDTERGFAMFVLGHLARRAGDAALADDLIARARAADPEVTTIDAWDVRLRLDRGASASTRGDVRALAPLMTGAAAAAAAAEERQAEPQDAQSHLPAQADGAETTGDGEATTSDADEHEDEHEPQDDHEHEDDHQDHDASSPESPVSVPAPPSDGPTPSARPAQSLASLFLLAVGVLALAAAAYSLYARTSHVTETPIVIVPVSPRATAASSEPPAASATPSAAPSPTPSTTPSATESSRAPLAEPAPTPSATPSASAIALDASYAETDAALPAVDATKGVLVTPPSADSHRVYVDGRLAGVPPPPLVVGCGRHTIKIGSQGRDQIVVVPCGGSIAVAYP